jgi:hypothetical protein
MPASNPEFNFLLDCLRRSLQPQSPAPLQPPIEIPTNLNWPALLTLAEQHAVLALVYPHLAPHAPIEITAAITAAWKSSWFHAHLLASELESLLAAFAQAGIEVMPIKGPVLAQTLFADVAARASLDLDLLVQHHNLPAAQAVLTASGFAAESITQPISGLAYDLPFRRGDTLLELHTSLGRPELCPLNSDEIWSRSHPATFRNQPVRAMSEEDSILYLTYHLLRHNCERLQWIADLARALEIQAAKSSGDSLLKSAQSQHLDQLLLFACALATETLQTLIPAAVAAAIQKQPKFARQAREFLEQNLAAPPSNRPARPTWSFYSAEPSARRRWTRRLRELAPTPADRLWARSNHIPTPLATPLLPFLRAWRVLRAYGVAGAWRNFMQGTR